MYQLPSMLYVHDHNRENKNARNKQIIFTTFNTNYLFDWIFIKWEDEFKINNISPCNNTPAL